MDAMAVGANRRLPVSSRNGLTVNALLELAFDWAMALAAGMGNVEFEDRRLGVSGGRNVVRSVTIGTYCGLFHTLGHGLTVHAFPIRDKGLGGAAGGCHHELLVVAGAASGGNIRVSGP